MDAEEYKTRTINVLRGHANELDSMENTIRSAAERRDAIPNVKEIYKEISDAAQECHETLDFYNKEDPFPDDVRIAMKRVQEAINHCAAALVLHQVALSM